MGAGFLGAQYAPFVVPDDPNSSSFRVRDVTVPPGIDDLFAFDVAARRIHLRNGRSARLLEVRWGVKPRQSRLHRSELNLYSLGNLEKEWS